jgi:D-alanine-D-alanine ligase
MAMSRTAELLAGETVMTKKQVTTKKIGVLMGGFSAERDISLRSGLAIYQSLQELGYNSSLIDVGKDIVQVLKKEKVKFVFLALHGGIGENGAIQGLLDVLGIPYTGSGVLASSLAMDKEVSKKIFKQGGLIVAPHIVLDEKSAGKGKKERRIPDIAFSPPWVVKPAAEGSSIGVSLVKKREDLTPSLDKAFSFGKRVLVEKFIPGREIHVAILGDRVMGGVEVRPSLEFYNYEAKYTSGLTEYIMPPEIEEEVYEKTKEMALSAYRELGCSGASRVDFIVDEEGSPYILEVNTIPGMTATSLLPKIARDAGLGYRELIEEMIRFALKK